MGTKMWIRTEVEFEIDTNSLLYDTQNDKYYEDPVIDAVFFLARKLVEDNVSLDCSDARLRVQGFCILWDGGLDIQPEHPGEPMTGKEAMSRIPAMYDKGPWEADQLREAKAMGDKINREEGLE